MSSIAVGSKSYQPEAVIQHAGKACSWFAIIAAFSAVNSILVLADAKFNFFVGLGATQVVDALLAIARERAQPQIAGIMTAIGLLVNLGIIGVLVAIWQLSKRGSAPAYVIGMVLYLLDTLIFLAVGYWAGAALHAFFLMSLWGGYAFVRQRPRAEQALSQPEMVSAGPQVSPV